MEKAIQICIGTDRAGNVRARLSLLVMSGGLVVSEHYHSVNMEPLDPLDEVRRRVEAHLAMEQALNGIPFAPWPPIPDEEWAKVEGVHQIFNAPALRRVSLVSALGASVEAARLEAGPQSDAVIVQNDN